MHTVHLLEVRFISITSLCNISLPILPRYLTTGPRLTCANIFAEFPSWPPKGCYVKSGTLFTSRSLRRASGRTSLKAHSGSVRQSFSPSIARDGEAQEYE